MSKPFNRLQTKQQLNTQLPSHVSSRRSQAGMCFISMIVMILVIIALVAVAFYVLKLNTVIVDKFEGKRWDIPAKVYSQPLELYQGAPVSRNDLKHMLGLLNYKPSDDYKRSGTYQYKNGTYFIHTRGFNYGDQTDKAQVLKVAFSGKAVSSIQSTRLTDSGIVRLEPVVIGGIYPDNNEDRVLVDLKDVPQPLIDALLATEDRAFYEHKGVSLKGIARALYTNMRGGKVQGGSTITQQLIKNFYLNSERTLKRKANEAVMALLLELHYSKQEILQAYMNEINLGQNGNRSINGFGLAAQFYYNQPLTELSVDKLAVLVGLAKGPSYYNPWRNPKAAKERRDVVLHNMVVTGKLSQEEYDTLKAKPIGVVDKPIVGKNRFPDFLNIVKRELKTQYKDEDLKSQGLRIFTTLDPVIQKQATDSFDASIKKLRKRNSKTKKLQGALVTASPINGELLAAVGGYGTFTGYNRALEAKRQVGSLLKPFVYLNALESGKYNLASPVDDSPITLKVANRNWSPANYDKRSHGYVPLHTALAKSYNQSTVRVGMEFGVKSFKQTLRKLGIKEDLPNYPSILLGAVDLTPMQMLQSYQVLAGNGFQHPIYSIRSVVDSKGKPLQRYSLNVEDSLNPASTYLINYALQDVVSNGTAKSLTSLGKNLNLAGKTGTTNGYKDAWFAGYSGNYVTVVWVGNDDNKPSGLSGSSGALPVWKNFMRKLRLDPVSLAQPRDVEWMWLDDGTGAVSDKRCSQSIYVPVMTAYTPQEVSDCAQNIFYQSQQPAPIPSGEEPSGSNPDMSQPTPQPQNTPEKAPDIIENVIKGVLEEAIEWF